MKLDIKKIRWIIREKKKGELSDIQIAEQMNISTRWVRKLWERHKHTDINKILPKKMGRPVSSEPGRKEHSAVINAFYTEYSGAVILHTRIKERTGINIAVNVIHRILKEEGFAKSEKNKKKKHKWCSYEREHSNSLWHTDWKQIHGGTHDGRWFLCYEDDASRFVTAYGIFDHATTENALSVLYRAMKNHGKPAAIMTDHGAQFYANEKESRKKGASKFEKKLAELDIMQILAGIRHPETNGKVERVHGEIQRKLHRFEEIMMRKSDPMDLFMQWYNYHRPHQSLDWDNQETPAQAYKRKMPKGKTIKDADTGEEYHVS